MTASTSSPPARRRQFAVWEWLRAHDRGFSALRRATRAALIMPAAFAFGAHVLDNPVLATFAAFGSFAMVLLVDFRGSIRDRLQSQAALALGCGALICVGTLVSRTTWLAALVTALVAFGVLFAGVVSSVLASATTTLLLSLILPVSLPGAVSSIPDRLAGWGIASGLSLLAISLLWPAPQYDPVRGTAIDALRALAARLRADVSFVLAGRPDALRAEHAQAAADADAAVDALQRGFFATPYRPTGLTTSARAIVRLVDELRWLNTIVLRSAPTHPGTGPGPEACGVRSAAAEVLERSVALLDAPVDAGESLHTATDRLRRAVADLERTSTESLPASAMDGNGAGNSERGIDGDRAKRIVSSLDPSFRAQELSFVVGQIAANVDFAAQADRRSWLERLLGRQPAGFPGLLSAAQERAVSYAERHSLWLQNSVRGGVGLGLAVLVADLATVQHGFWVAFATLSVLRSSALGTGQSIARALLGTTAGFVIGGALVALIGTNTAVLWTLLPFAVLLAGLAPAAISFTAGQAAFTLTLLILFNLLAPAGWRIGLVRVEDIAIGCAVSLIVGLMLWPRGAGAALGRALSAAYTDSAAYLAEAVAYGLGRCDASTPTAAEPTTQAASAAAAARRLDDTFRGYLAERGAKPMPLAEMTALVTGIAGLRLAADAVVELWQGDRADGGDRAAARRELLAGSQTVSGWYDRFADSLAGRGDVPPPVEADSVADGRLVDAVGHDLRDPEGQATATAVRVIWTGDHLDAARRLQGTLVPPARQAVSQRALG
ncbi:MAG: FUSC family protein [Solirubrobacteraceae bacterium]